jgi:dihydrofolate reductase
VRKVVVQEFVTLDGYAAGPNGELDFIESSTHLDATGGDFVEAQRDFIGTIDSILLGATTYRMFAGYWPEQTTDTEAIADALNETPKIVFSRTLERAHWGSWEEPTVVREDATEEVRRLKQRDGKDMVVWGSLTVAHSLMSAGLVDEYHLWLCPVVIGGGIRLLPEGVDTRTMRWVETRPYDGDVLAVKFRPSDE